MNYRELSQVSGLKYDTVRNYAKVLIDEGLVKAIDESTVSVVKRFPNTQPVALPLKRLPTKPLKMCIEALDPKRSLYFRKALRSRMGKRISEKRTSRKQRSDRKPIRKLESLSEEETPATSELVCTDRM